MFPLMIEIFRVGDGDPAARAAGFTRLEEFRVVISILLRFKTELHCGGGRVFHGGPEFRIRMGLQPEQAADAETRDQKHAGEEGTKPSQIGLE
jgi:hypothetical protein